MLLTDIASQGNACNLYNDVTMNNELVSIHQGDHLFGFVTKQICTPVYLPKPSGWLLGVVPTEVVGCDVRLFAGGKMENEK